MGYTLCLFLHLKNLWQNLKKFFFVREKKNPHTHFKLLSGKYVLNVKWKYFNMICVLYSRGFQKYNALNLPNTGWVTNNRILNRGSRG